MSFLLSQLITLNPSFPPVVINHLTQNSQEVTPGSLFLSCKGAKGQGKKFISEAVQKGAVAVLIETGPEEDQAITWQETIPIIPFPSLSAHLGIIASQFYHNPGKQLSIVGVTGTNGKTSCTHLLAGALHYLKKPCGVIGTLGNGLYGHLQASQFTTPDAVTLHGLLNQFTQQGAQYVAMEVSSHSLDQGRVNAVPFDVAILTNITQDHLDYHLTMAAYAAAKEKLFTEHAPRYSLINTDDTYGQALFKSLSQTQNTVFSYGLTASAMISASHIESDLSHLCAHIKTPWGEGEVRTGLVGQFNLANLLAVISTLCLLGFALEVILTIIPLLTPIAGRMQAVGGKDKPLVVIDYSHTPDALEKALFALKAHCLGRLICVFGCGGDRDRLKRPLMAAIAERYADYVLLTDDNPRTENPDTIFNDILAGFKNPHSIYIEHDRAKAIGAALNYARIGDCVLVAGKGAETYQVIGDKKIYFSDVDVVQETLHAGLAQ